MLFALSCGSVAQKSNSDGGPDASGVGGISGAGGISGTGGISGNGGVSGTGGGMTGAGGAAAGGSSGSTHFQGGIVTVASDVVKTTTVRLVEHGVSRSGKSCGLVQGNNVCVIGGIKP